MRPDPGPPEGARLTRLRHRVAFYETDAMGVVHHSNYVRFFEEARVQWLIEHDRPYTEWIALGLQFAVTEARAHYHQSARFGDELEVTAWMEHVRGASLAMGYVVHRGATLVASGATEHAAVDAEGRVRRIPREDRARLAAHCPPGASTR